MILIPAPTGQNTPASGSPRAGTASESSSQARSRTTPQAQDGWDPPPFNIPAQRSSNVPASQPRPAAPPASPRTAEALAAPRPRPESLERASAAATATPPSPISGLPEFTPPPAVPPFNPPPSAPYGGLAAPPFVPGGARPATPPRAQSSPPPAPTSGSDGGARRPVNPFLSKDPNQRAKRLARALVSDIITYHPAKHAEGLRDGTLKQLFREEIKKSFEEYIAQVGQQLAESTTYFQEALNEVLGAGKKIF
ncbi:MAG TPA: hypothetical protein VD771_07980 [Gemmatimonadaceae bacterium]|nr:hypothetical protein [Gemmatimonadaceae bacterium]